jgi:hypothetical protein
MINDTIALARCPLILPVVEHTHLDESEQATSEARCASGIAQRIERACRATSHEPVSRRDLPACLDDLLRQHVHQIILLPWCLQGSASNLLARATSALQQGSQHQVSSRVIQRPRVHVHGVSSAGPLGGFIPAQERLDRCVAQLPGWHTMYTCLQAEHAAILVPQTAQARMQFKHRKDIAQLELALFSELSPDEPLHHLFCLDDALLKDATIYAGYLMQLLCRAIESSFPPSFLSLPEAASSPTWRR